MHDDYILCKTLDGKEVDTSEENIIRLGKVSELWDKLSREMELVTIYFNRVEGICADFLENTDCEVSLKSYNNLVFGCNSKLAEINNFVNDIKKSVGNFNSYLKDMDEISKEKNEVFHKHTLGYIGCCEKTIKNMNEYSKSLKSHMDKYIDAYSSLTCANSKLEFLKTQSKIFGRVASIFRKDN